MSGRPTPRLLSALSVALLGACGGAGQPTASAAPTVADQLLVADPLPPPRAGADLLESAVLVGGPRGPAERAAMTRSLDATLTTLLSGAALPDDPVARGRAVLALLFSDRAGRPLLREYVADATTLNDIVTTGRFNCVSATMLYIVAAKRVGLDARPVLLPSHARGLVVVGANRYVVETTIRNGFDPPASVSREALDRARPRGLGPHVDLYADERGTEVEWNALLGIAYGNLGILARARGERALAEALLERELSLTPPAQAPLVRAQQASLLTELATHALQEAKWSEALSLAFRADEAAADARTKSLTGQNLTAIASQQLAAEGAGMDDAKLLAYAEPFRNVPASYGDIRSLALTLIGQRKLQRGDVEGGAAALREAAQVATTTDVRGQAGHNARIGELDRLAKLSAGDPEAAWTALQALGPPDPTLGAGETEIRQAIAENRAVRLSNEGHCEPLEDALRAASSARADALRASCHERHGLTLSERNDFPGAIVELREAVRLDPAAPRHRQNLVVLIEQQIDRLVHHHGCAEIGPLLTEGRALDPTAVFFRQSAEFCKHAP